MTFEAVRDFILENWSTAMTWEPELFEGWLRWHADKEFLFLVRDDDKLTGLAVARPVTTITVTDNGYEYDEKGPIIFLDLVIAETRRVMRSLAGSIIETFGPMPFVALKRNGKLKAHRLDKVIKALSKHEFTTTPITTASA